MSLTKVRDLCLEAERCHNLGMFRDGLALAEQAVVECARTLGRAHYAYPLSLCALGWLRHAVGEGASAVFAEAVMLARQLAAEDFEHAIVVISHAADYARECAEADRSGELEAELLSLHQLHLGESHPRTCKIAARSRRTEPPAVG